MFDPAIIKLVIVAVLTVVLSGLGFVLVLRLTKSSAEKRQHMEYSHYREMSIEQLEVLKAVRSDIAELKERVLAIDKILKDVE